MPDTFFCIMAKSGTCIQQPAADIGQAIRRARQVLPEGEKIVGAIQTDCIVAPEPEAGPFRVLVVRNQLQPASSSDTAVADAKGVHVRHTPEQTGGQPDAK